MLPTILQLGPISITSLGVSLFLAFLVGSFFIWRKGKEENFDAQPLLDGIILGTGVAIIFSRLVFLLVSPGKNLMQDLNFFSYPGFSYFGAFLGSFLFLLYFCHKQKWDFFKLGDVLVFGIIPAQIILRIGNLLDGSFWGKSASVFWAFPFSGLEQRRHPLALYEIIFLSLLLYLMYKLERQYRFFSWYKNKRGEAKPGFLLLVYVFAYSSFRFLLEFFKDSSLYWLNLSWEQWVSLILAFLSLVLLYIRSGRGIVNPLKKLLPAKLKNLQEVKKPIINPAPQKRDIPKRPFHVKAGMDAK